MCARSPEGQLYPGLHQEKLSWNFHRIAAKSMYLTVIQITLFAFVINNDMTHYFQIRDSPKSHDL